MRRSRAWNGPRRAHRPEGARRRGERATSALAGIGSEFHGSRQERGGRRPAAAGLRTDRLSSRARPRSPSSRPIDGLSPMPGQVVRIGVADHGLGERLRGPPSIPFGGARDTPPTASADGGTEPARRVSSSPASCAGTTASAGMPSHVAARHSRVTSPDGSAAASSISWRVGCGELFQPSDETLFDPPGEQRRCRTEPIPNASSAASSSRGSSRSASGFPRASARMRLRTRSSSGPATAESNRAAASASARPRTMSSGSPSNASLAFAHIDRIPYREDHPDALRSEAPGHERRASARRRCRSIAHRRGRREAAVVSATSAKSPSTASPTRNRSGGSPVREPNAVPSACRCGSGRWATWFEERRAELLEHRIREFDLRLHARRPRDREAVRMLLRGNRAERSCRRRPRPVGPAHCCRPDSALARSWSSSSHSRRLPRSSRLSS